MIQTGRGEIGHLVCQLARQAGGEILAVYEKSFNISVEFKVDASPLTAADLAAHHCIAQGLAALTPDIPVVSEESAGSLIYRLPTGRFWLVDPLDGTKEFLARSDQFTVNIALVEDGRVTWGVVYAPLLNELYWGGRFFGAFKEERGSTRELRVAGPVAEGGSYRVVASKSHLNSETEAFIMQLGLVELVQAGSSLKLCLVAEGAADVYPRLAPTCEWDTAAAQAIVEGAGGFVVDTAGEVLLYGKPDVLNPSFVVASVPLDRLVHHA